MASHLRQSQTDPYDMRTDHKDGLPITSTSAGRHAQHVGNAHGSNDSVRHAFQRLDPSVTGSFAAITNESLQPINTPVTAEESAPRPISADPSVTNSFSRITPAMAAQSITRDNSKAVHAQHETAGAYPQHKAHRPNTSTSHLFSGVSRPFTIAIAFGVIAVLGVGATVLHSAFLNAEPTPTTTSEDVAQVNPTESITDAGSTYALVDNGDGTYTLTVRTGEYSDTIGVALLNGEPAQIVAYKGSIIVPESYADSTWDVIAYTPGGDALATQVVNEQGEPVHGSGTIAEVRLEDSKLVIVDTTGTTTTVALEN